MAGEMLPHIVHCFCPCTCRCSDARGKTCVVACATFCWCWVWPSVGARRRMYNTLFLGQRNDLLSPGLWSLLTVALNRLAGKVSGWMAHRKPLSHKHFLGVSFRDAFRTNSQFCFWLTCSVTVMLRVFYVLTADFVYPYSSFQRNSGLRGLQ